MKQNIWQNLLFHIKITSGQNNYRVLDSNFGVIVTILLFPFISMKKYSAHSKLMMCYDKVHTRWQMHWIHCFPIETFFTHAGKTFIKKMAQVARRRSDTFFGWHQEGIDIFKSFKLRLINLLYNITENMSNNTKIKFLSQN